MSTQTILLADDDVMIVEALRFQLEREDFDVLTAYDGVAALELARSARADLILLDVMMPRMHGWEVCRDIRKESTIPIIMLTARGEEMDRVMGLELGADDYVIKPFSFRELLARVRANLRRVDFADQVVERNESAPLVIGPLCIDKKRRQVIRENEPVPLSQREYDVLIALLDAHGAVVPRGDLLDAVWGETWVGDPRTLDVHIRWCREKLEDNSSKPELILTVRGVGYRLVTPDELAS